MAIRAYQRTVSPDHGSLRKLRGRPFCPQRPTCSEFALQTLADPIPLGTALRTIAVRIARCR